MFMGICPQCGWPKHVHNLEKLPGLPRRRICMLVLANPDEVDEGKPARMKADAALYRQRLAAHEELREMRFDD